MSATETVSSASGFTDADCDGNNSTWQSCHLLNKLSKKTMQLTSIIRDHTRNQCDAAALTVAAGRGLYKYVPHASRVASNE